MVLHGSWPVTWFDETNSQAGSYAGLDVPTEEDLRKLGKLTANQDLHDMTGGKLKRANGFSRA